MTLLRVTDDTTRDELVTALALLNHGAKLMSRRGKVGTLSGEYARQHERMDALLAELALHSGNAPLGRPSSPASHALSVRHQP